MSTLTADSAIYRTGEGSIINNGSGLRTTSQHTPSQKVSIAEGLASHTAQSSSASTLNAIQTPESDIAAASLSEEESQSILDSLQLIHDLDLFLATAPVNWHENQVIRRYFLNKEEGFVSCVYWNNLYFITGTDIVRCIAYKMAHIGRQIVDRKKFEEGIFSDLRALKCGTHAVLENSRSQFLKFLHRNQCLRTQKKQKVFFWFSVPHNKLFADVLERDLKRELSNQPATTKPVSPVFRSFQFDQSLPLMEQLSAYFSNFLGKNVNSLLLKSSNPMQASADGITNAGSNHTSANLHAAVNASANKDSSSNFAASNNSNSNTASILRTLGDSPIDTSKSNNNHNMHMSDDFPLDFLDPSSQFLSENYITSISPVDGGLRANSQFFLDRQNFIEDPLFASGRSPQFQLHPQLQQQQQPQQQQQYHLLHQQQQSQQQHQHGLLSSQLQEHIDSFLLNSGQPLLSASYSQPQNLSVNQQLFLLSDLPSAIEPTHTFLESQIPKQSSPLPSSLSQLVPVSLHHPHIIASPSTILTNNDNQLSIDQVLVPTTEQPLQQNSEQYIHLRDSSSPINLTNTNTSAYMNLPSASLLPVSFPVPSSASFKLVSRPEDSNAAEGSQLSGSTTESNNVGIDPSLTAKETDSEPSKTEEIKVKSEVTDSTSTIPATVTPGIQSNQQQDYMMLMPSYANNVSRMNFGIIGGQIFTPGSIGVEYSFDNAAFSAGFGISPVIGFNNGLLSAIQYQSSKVTDIKHLSSLANEFDTKADDDGTSDKNGNNSANDDDDSDITTNDSNDKSYNGTNNCGIDSGKSEEDAIKNVDSLDPVDKSLLNKTSNKLKGILLREGQSKVTKKKNVQLPSKRNFLNPTLRHLHLDDVFDGKG